jgi:glycosyltransferase involved in cell wall biosynthesis
MRILFLTPQLPYPPQQGTAIRNFNIIKVLASRHEVHILSFGKQEELQGSPLRDFCSRIEIVPAPVRSMFRRGWETFLSPHPDMARRLSSRAMADSLRIMLDSEKYDLLQIEGIEMAGPWMQIGGPEGDRAHLQTKPQAADKQPAITVFDDHNAEYVLQKTAYESDRRLLGRIHGALYSYIQWHKLERFERSVCLRACHVAAVSDSDARALRRLDPRIDPVVIPNGVDLSLYVPSDEVCAKPLAELAVVFTGKMDFRPNVDAAVWFTDEILPLIRHAIPLAHVSYVGQQPSAQVRALASRPGVQVTGWVTDTRPYVADAAVFVVPLRMGGGTRLKVLEAMAMGKAIVCTTLGAEGIDCKPGQDLIIADRAEDFARATVSLLRDPTRQKELGGNARRLVEARYDWNAIVGKFDGIYQSRR